MLNNATVAALAAAIWVGVCTTAQAYIDPGTGSLVLQILIGSIAGGIAVARLYWTKLREIMSRAAAKVSGSPRELD